MITDATAASSSALVTDIIACVPPALIFLFEWAGRRWAEIKTVGKKK
jgi:hypothetical protein